MKDGKLGERDIAAFQEITKFDRWMRPGKIGGFKSTSSLENGGIVPSDGMA
jgi:hypothetical protein